MDLGIDMWREHRSMPNQQKTSQPIAQLGGAIVASISGLRSGVPGTAGIGAMVKLGKPVHLAFECMKVTIPVIADVHPASTDQTVAIKNAEFPTQNPCLWANGKGIVPTSMPLPVISKKSETGQKVTPKTPAISSHLTDSLISIVRQLQRYRPSEFGADISKTCRSCLSSRNRTQTSNHDGRLHATGGAIMPSMSVLAEPVALVARQEQRDRSDRLGCDGL